LGEKWESHDFLQASHDTRIIEDFLFLKGLLQSFLGFKHLQNNYSEYNVGQSIILQRGIQP
jgi:hypothetical protein